jgi:hypothetical protein
MACPPLEARLAKPVEGSLSQLAAQPRLAATAPEPPPDGRAESVERGRELSSDNAGSERAGGRWAAAGGTPRGFVDADGRSDRTGRRGQSPSRAPDTECGGRGAAQSDDAELRPCTAGPGGLGSLPDDAVTDRGVPEARGSPNGLSQRLGTLAVEGPRRRDGDVVLVKIGRSEDGQGQIGGVLERERL